MFTIFTFMYYVYVLYMNDIPFYAGMSRRPAIRYREHYADAAGACSNYVRYMANEFDKYMTMKIIAYSHRKPDAARIEHNCITMLFTAGFMTFNRTSYPHPKFLNVPSYPFIKNIKSLKLGVHNIKKMIKYE